MREIEVKILEIDRDRIEQTLISHGAKQRFDGKITARYYARPDLGKVLRLRKRGNLTELTIKEPLSRQHAKIMHEHEIIVNTFEGTHKLLAALGYTPFTALVKHRTEYTLSKVHFVFDKILETHEHIPEFLEIEAPTVKDIHKWAAVLGYKPEDCKPWSGKDVIEHYR